MSTEDRREGNIVDLQIARRARGPAPSAQMTLIPTMAASSLKNRCGLPMAANRVYGPARKFA